MKLLQYTVNLYGADGERVGSMDLADVCWYGTPQNAQGCLDPWCVPNDCVNELRWYKWLCEEGHYEHARRFVVEQLGEHVADYWLVPWYYGNHHDSEEIKAERTAALEEVLRRYERSADWEPEEIMDPWFNWEDEFVWTPHEEVEWTS